MEAKYPEQVYLTILGQSWFRGDFNISYRFVNRPGPDGDKMNQIKPLPPPDKGKVDQKNPLTIIIILACSISFILFIVATVLSCLYLKRRK